MVTDPVLLVGSACEFQVLASLLYVATMEFVLGTGGGLAGHCATRARLAEPTT
jgi:hypothetical protein